MKKVFTLRNLGIANILYGFILALGTEYVFGGFLMAITGFVLVFESEDKTQPPVIK
jgi:hypothetical protein